MTHRTGLLILSVAVMAMVVIGYLVVWAVDRADARAAAGISLQIQVTPTPTPTAPADYGLRVTDVTGISADVDWELYGPTHQFYTLYVEEIVTGEADNDLCRIDTGNSATSTINYVVGCVSPAQPVRSTELTGLKNASTYDVALFPWNSGGNAGHVRGDPAQVRFTTGSTDAAPGATATPQ